MTTEKWKPMFTIIGRPERAGFNRCYGVGPDRVRGTSRPVYFSAPPKRRSDTDGLEEDRRRLTLAAAAPDLLSALNDLLHYTQRAERADSGRPDDDLCTLCETAKAAIKKARGS